MYSSYSYSSSSNSNSLPIKLSFLHPNDTVTYQHLFTQHVPSLQHRLSATTVKHILVQSGLPNEILAEIWNLANCSKNHILLHPYPR
ncbi:hypothetical protein HMI56_007241 [Coelomomyces lativittatus]|nr:hypothetical protein HMI56_007241 [Coelomomyces lativittatus]